MRERYEYTNTNKQFVRGVFGHISIDMATFEMYTQICFVWDLPLNLTFEFQNNSQICVAFLDFCRVFGHIQIDKATFEMKKQICAAAFGIYCLILLLNFKTIYK